MKRYHVHALPNRAHLEIKYPRVEGYTQAIRNRITVDWENVPDTPLLPNRIPPEVEVKGLSVSNRGRALLSGPGRIDRVDLEAFRAQHRLQELVFDLARALARDYRAQAHCDVPTHVLFPQLAGIVQRYLKEKVRVYPPADVRDIFLAPYYGWVVEILIEHIHSDVTRGEAPEVPRYESSRGPGSTSEVHVWTSREVREITRSHLNYIIADTKRWEQSAAYYLDTSEAVSSFAKNAGLGFAIPYLYNGQMHDYVPDFLVRLKGHSELYLVLETKGYDPLEKIKSAAAQRWVSAVNNDGKFGHWAYRLAKTPTEIPTILKGLGSQALE